MQKYLYNVQKKNNPLKKKTPKSFKKIKSYGYVKYMLNFLA